MGGLYADRYPSVVELAPEELSHLTRMPPGRHHLPRDFVARHQRDRLMVAMTGLVVGRGFAATSLTQIVKTAGVARHTFYEHFESKEALFVAILDEAADEAVRRVLETTEAETGAWEAKVRVGLAAFLGYVAENPPLARVCLCESQSAGPVALDHYELALRRFDPLFRLGRRNSPMGADLPESMEDIVVGGIVWMINKSLLHGEGDRIESSLPAIVEFALTPYMGEAAAKHVAAAETMTAAQKN